MHVWALWLLTPLHEKRGKKKTRTNNFKFGQTRFGQTRPEKDGQSRFGQTRFRPFSQPFALTENVDSSLQTSQPAEGNPWEHIPSTSTALSDTRSVGDEGSQNILDWSAKGWQKLIWPLVWKIWSAVGFKPFSSSLLLVAFFFEETRFVWCSILGFWQCALGDCCVLCSILRVQAILA